MFNLGLIARSQGPCHAVMFRQCAIKYKKSGTRMPRVELDEMGPSFDFTLGRHQEAPADVRREAFAKASKGKKVKNVTQDSLEGKAGWSLTTTGWIDVYSTNSFSFSSSLSVSSSSTTPSSTSSSSCPRPPLHLPRPPAPLPLPPPPVPPTSPPPPCVCVSIHPEGM